MKWIQKLFKKKDEKFKIPKRYQYLENRNPNRPINFGYKTIWSAVKSDDHKEVADFLGFDKNNECNWVEGMVRSFGGEIFILPSINNWVLLHGMALPYPYKMDNLNGSDKFLNKLSQKYGDAQMFGGHRVSSSVFWMRSIEGELKRLYLVADGEGGTIGEPTEVERLWNLIDFSSPEIENEEYYENAHYPDEEEATFVAESWSINPMTLESIKDVEGRGIFGKMKNLHF